MKHILTLILFSFAFCYSKEINEIGTSPNQLLADSIASTQTISQDSVLLVFRSDSSSLTFDCSMDSVKPIRNGNLFKIMLSAADDGKKTFLVQYSYMKSVLNFGLKSQPNYQPILTGGETRAFDVHLYSRIECKPQAPDKAPLTRQTEFQGKALLVFVSKDTIREFTFKSTDTILKSEKNNSKYAYYLIVNPKPQQIIIATDDFDSTILNIDTLENYENKNYLLSVPTTSDEPKEITQRIPSRQISLKFLSKPSGVEVFSDQVIIMNNRTPCTVDGLLYGDYTFTFVKKYYKTLDTTITIDKNTPSLESITAKMELVDFGKITLPKLKNSSDLFTVDKQNVQADEVELTPGKHKVKFTTNSNDFASFDTTIDIEKNQIIPISLRFTEEYKNSRHNRAILRLTSLSTLMALFIGGGIGCNYYAEESYKDYKALKMSPGSTEYSKKWDDVNTYKTLRAVSYIAAGVAAAGITLDIIF